MAVRLIALKAHRYAGKQLKPGDAYEASGESDARLMRALGNARDPDPVIETPRASSEEAPAEPVAAKKVAGKRAGKRAAKKTYSRRDLRAE